MSTGVKAFLYGALVDSAKALAEDGLRPIEAAALAVDVFGQDGGLVQFGP